MLERIHVPPKAEVPAKGRKKNRFGDVDFSQQVVYSQLRAEIHELRKPKLNVESLRTFHTIEDARARRGDEGLRSVLHSMLHERLANLDLSRSRVLDSTGLADLRYPYEWYSDARTMQREVHLHVGPTNSGKTYHALKRLEQANTGVYAGPLRLLAHEVYNRLNAMGKKCNMITGDQVIMADDMEAVMNSCTVEMVPQNTRMEVAVIDEIQMIGDSDRGWAWTAALLGLQAKEVHLCGEERALPLIEKICAATGDTLIIHRYERLSPLGTMRTSLAGDLRKLRKGDCVVAFSRKLIHGLKTKIEQTHGKRVAIVYGALPPEVRAEQARLFNDPSNDYDFLVASDAIGMGLNLSIKRIIFHTVTKRDVATNSNVRLQTPSIKQIAGRAGRYRVASSAQTKKPSDGSVVGIDDKPESPVPPTPASTGLVTTLNAKDLSWVARAMKKSPKPIEQAVLMPPDELLTRFASYFRPEAPFSYILRRFAELSQTDSLFRMVDHSSMASVADVIQEVPGLSIRERITFCSAPVKTNNEGMRRATREFAQCVANRTDAVLHEMEHLDLEVLDAPEQRTELYLNQLETLHQSLTLYIWLTYRFMNVFVTQALAFHAKVLVEEKIERYLAAKPSKLIVPSIDDEDVDVPQDGLGQNDLDKGAVDQSSEDSLTEPPEEIEQSHGETSPPSDDAKEKGSFLKRWFGSGMKRSNNIDCNTNT